MENRRLIRPSIESYRKRGSSSARQEQPRPGPERERDRNRPDRERDRDRHREPQGPGRRPSPSDQTHAEAFYYLKQMTAATPMVVVLDGGEELLGRIEWYDERCINFTRPNGSSVLVYKEAIKYMYKLEELEARQAGRASDA